MLQVTFYNLSVKLRTDSQNLMDAIRSFLSTYYTTKGQSFSQNLTTPDKVFVSQIKSENIYYFHTNQFIHLCHWLQLKGINISTAEKFDKRKYTVKMEDYTVRDGWVLRDQQVPVCEFLVTDPVRSKMVSLQTGKGKTAVSLIALAQLKKRIGVVILSTYIEKWVLDIATIHNATTMDVMVIQGSKALRGLVAMAKSGELTTKYYIFSSRTLQEFISEFEENPDHIRSVYGIEPIDLFPLLGIGTMLIDETHQAFHSIFKILLHTNVEYQVGLSATLLSDDSTVTRIHKVVYPKKCIYDGGELDKYCDVYALSYYIPEQFIRKVKTTNFGSNSYSHTAFEQSIMRLPPLYAFYVRLINNTIKDFYIDRYEKKDKCMVFVATVKMATILAEFLQKSYPHLQTRRYCEDDPYENVMEGDFIVSTVISAGTALDIPDLRVVVQTVSISSSVSNIQTLGRLRKLSNNRDTRFCYLYAENINKQRVYHHKRQELFSNRVATHSVARART